jgi:two-component system sensor histidine kinase/response regulator
MAKTILVVEDSPVQALALSRLLEKQGLAVLCAPNGLAGLKLAHERHPDAIVLDIQMPEMDGLEACHFLHNDPQTTDIPIVLLTGQSTPNALRTGLEDGAVDFIPKDAFSDAVLLETLRQLEIL